MFTLKISKLNKFMNAKLLELLLTSICLGKVIPKLFVKKSVPGSLLFVETNFMLGRKLIFLDVTLLPALTSIIAVKYGMFWRNTIKKILKTTK